MMIKLRNRCGWRLRCLGGVGLLRCASVLAALLLLKACAAPAVQQGVPAPDPLPPPLLLVSLDGFRADYLGGRELPNLQRLLDEGAHAGALIPVFPTKTFPTHYSMVTGLYPAQHGVVGNSMYDPRRDETFSMRQRDAVSDPFWWGGEPIWVTAMNQGLIAATFFWPGSEAPIGGRHPDIWFPYDGQVPYPERAARVLGWLDREPAERPSMITLYMDRVDSAGHWSGPESDEVAAAMIEVDEILGMVMQGLEQRGQLDEVNIIIVSDHGMLDIPQEQNLLLVDHLDMGRVRVSEYGPVAMLQPDEDYFDEAWQLLTDFHPNVRVYRPEDLPEAWRFRDHPRIPEIVLVADPGWSIERPRFGRSSGFMPASHGWAPEHPAMHGIFLARGPGFHPGARVECLHAIHLYAMMVELLDLQAAPNEGNPAAYARLLRAPSVTPDAALERCPEYPPY